ncbi:MAG TPA: hypothetical protein VEQ41_09655 [Solirubrobacterales bacterium]|nr:hypothetical protein [Solirubrobacterales bacterium]
MNTKLKAIGLAVAAFALGAVFTAPGSATTGGHFTSGDSHTSWIGTVHTPNVFTWAGGQKVVCSKVTYLGTTTAMTTESLKLTPNYELCELWWSGENEGPVKVANNECFFQLTIGKKAGAHNTAHLNCPAGKQMEIQIPIQIMKIPPQTIQGVAFTATTESGVGALTVAFTTNLTTHCETGLACAWATSTDWFGSFHGSLTLRGLGTGNEPVGIQATGSED